MSRPPSVLVTRKSPSARELAKIMKKERDGAMVRRLYVILIMIKMQNAEQVASLCEVDPETVRSWVKTFNEEGIEGLRKKKVPDDAAS